MLKNKGTADFFLLLAPSLVLALYSYVGLNSRLMADDFCTIIDAQRFKMLRFIWHWYNNWGGRYSAIATDELLDSIGATGVPFVPLVVLVVWTAVSSFMCHYFLRKIISKESAIPSSILLGAMIVFTITIISPGFDKVLFWWNGMRTYIPPLATFSLLIGFLYWAMGRPNAKKPLFLAMAMSFLIALFSGGYNETFTFVQSLFFTGWVGLIILLKRLRSNDPLPPLLFAAALGSVLALVIMLASPGAALRRDIFVSAPLGIPAILEITFTGYLDYLSGIFGSLEKISALLALLLVCVWLGTRSENTFRNGWLVIFAIAVGTLISLASLLPSAYGLGKMPALRTFSVPTYILVISVGVASLLFGNWLAGRATTGSVKYLDLGMLICVVVSVFYSSWLNAKTLYSDRGIYIEYAQQWDSIDAQIKQAKLAGAESVTIPATNNWARLDQPNQNPKYWATRCYTEFYGIQVYGPPSGP